MPQEAVAEGVADAGAEPLEARQACISKTPGPSELVDQLAAWIPLDLARAADKPFQLINIQRRWCHWLCGGEVSSFRFTRYTSDNYDCNDLDPASCTGLASKNIGMMHSWICLS